MLPKMSLSWDLMTRSSTLLREGKRKNNENRMNLITPPVSLRIKFPVWILSWSGNLLKKHVNIDLWYLLTEKYNINLSRISVSFVCFYWIVNNVFYDLPACLILISMVTSSPTLTYSVIGTAVGILPRRISIQLSKTKWGACNSNRL